MINLNLIYYLVGLMFLCFSLFNLFNKERGFKERFFSFSFWFLYALIFLFGNFLSAFIVGIIVVSLSVLAELGLFKNDIKASDKTQLDNEESRAKIYKNKLFIPALLVPIITLLGTFTLKYIPIFESKNHTLISLTLGIIISLILALVLFNDKPMNALRGGSVTMNSIGWAGILPQMLAALGILFSVAGMGTEVQSLLTQYFPLKHPLVVVATYTFSMALFTMIMGNAFAAFPVISGAIAVPILIFEMGANPTVVGAIGMLSGFCGTLMTPMAANFNIVPAALLELGDKNLVIKVQIPTAIAVLICNTAIMFIFCFPKVA